MSSDIAIRVENVSKTFHMYERPEHRLLELLSFGRVQRHRDFEALKDIDLVVRRGETVGIIGRNGCGKSTLLQIVCGILQPTRGMVETKGRVAALLELGAGFNGEFTGRENVYLNGGILGLTREEMNVRLADIVAFADIGEFIDRPVKTYSSGMFVRLAFATAINIDPDILVVDEALSVGDEAFQRKCFARIEQIKEGGGTILFVSHSAHTIVQLCDRAVLLDSGEKLLDGSPKGVVNQYQRLASASPQAAMVIRNDIVAAAARGNTGDEGTALASRSEPEKQAEPERLDPELKSQSATRHDEAGASIERCRILNMNGAEVNVLRRGRRYLFEYDVTFTEDASEVGFGMGLTTVQGVLLSGWAARGNRVAAVNQGEAVTARFEFQCIYLPGSYFVTCHVRGRTSGDEQTLHRISDALMFRVANDHDRDATGMVESAMIANVHVTG